MRSKTLRLLLSVTCLAIAFWATPRASLALETCPSDYCGTKRAQCEDAGGHFWQTTVTACDLNGTTQTAYNWVCQSVPLQFTDGVCYGI
jgi:hypothetical protein